MLSWWPKSMGQDPALLIGTVSNRRRCVKCVTFTVLMEQVKREWGQDEN